MLYEYEWDQKFKYCPFDVKSFEASDKLANALAPEGKVFVTNCSNDEETIQSYLKNYENREPIVITTAYDVNCNIRPNLVAIYANEENG